MALQCPQCGNNYTSSGEFQPRLLVSCGHTFCQRCLKSLTEASSTYIICCPQCDAPIREPHAPNITIIQYVDAQGPRPGVQASSVAGASCESCSKEQAALICFQCLASGVKFCRACSDKEHNRDFGPARSHKPKPISQAFLTTSVPNCLLHPSTQSRLFSLKLKSFACDLCCQTPGFDASSYLTIEGAMCDISTKLPVLIQQAKGQMTAIERTQEELNEAMHMLDLEKGKRSDELEKAFSNFEQALQKRYGVLVRNVEHEVHIIVFSINSWAISNSFFLIFIFYLYMTRPLPEKSFYKSSMRRLRLPREFYSHPSPKPTTCCSKCRTAASFSKPLLLSKRWSCSFSRRTRRFSRGP